MKSNQRPNRDPPDFAPSEAWIKAFEDGYTQLTILNLTNYARACARHLGAPSSYPEDIVQNVAVDTVQVILAWDPTQKSLKQHLRDAIKTRTHHARARARRVTYYPLDDSTPEGLATLALATTKWSCSTAPPSSRATRVVESRTPAFVDKQHSEGLCRSPAMRIDARPPSFERSLDTYTEAAGGAW